MIMPRGQASGLFVFPDYPPSISLTVINPSPCLPSPERSIYDKRDCLSTSPRTPSQGGVGTAVNLRYKEYFSLSVFAH